jgi:uncharacterized membrane protein SpoIIM required for sporulation
MSFQASNIFVTYPHNIIYITHMHTHSGIAIHYLVRIYNILRDSEIHKHMHTE